MSLGRFSIAVAALVFALATAAPSQAAVVLGELKPAGFPTQLGCSSGQVIVQTGTSTVNDYSVPPGGGVITRWSTVSWTKGSADALVQLVVTGSDVTDNNVTYNGLSDFETVVSPELAFPQSFETRIPVSGGERLGLYGKKEGFFVYTCAFGFKGGKANRVIFGSVAQPVLGAPPTNVPSEFLEERIPLEVVLEPDADHDGFGDESQDLCPTVAVTQGSCPLAPPPLVAQAPLTPQIPETAISRRPKLKTTIKKAVFEFTSTVPTAGFECQRDDGPFRACSSPYERRFGVGKHTFAVRATAQGQVDASPATFSWRVKKKPPSDPSR